MACHNLSGTRSSVVVMAADHAHEQSEQQEPAESRKHALSATFLKCGSRACAVAAWVAGGDRPPPTGGHGVPAGVGAASPPWRRSRSRPPGAIPAGTSPSNKLLGKDRRERR